MLQGPAWYRYRQAVAPIQTPEIPKILEVVLAQVPHTEGGREARKRPTPSGAR